MPELNPSHTETPTARTLRVAAENGVLLAVTRHSDGVSVTGSLIKIADNHIEIAVSDVARLDHASRTDRRHDVTLAINEEIFWFRADLLAIRATADGATLVMGRPAQLATRQRRRFWRAPVRQSTSVTLIADALDAPCLGAVLNVSPDGLACRVERIHADRLNPGDKIEIQFSLDADQKTISTAAEIKARTQASDPRHAILRLQFLCEEVKSELRDRLEPGSPATS